MTASRSLDVRGLSCPEPVIRTKQALSDPVTSSLTVTADNVVAAENIKRLAKSMGLVITVAHDNNEFIITIAKEV
jgi:tRNA 2-thiouridine synthesizing protein A